MLRVPAWTSDGVLGVHAGTLELTAERLRFILESGEPLFDVRRVDATVRFPWIIPDGMVVVDHQSKRTVLFGDPHSVGSMADARAVRRKWRRELDARGGAQS
jgi:hypothetical protein